MSSEIDNLLESCKNNDRLVDMISHTQAVIQTHKNLYVSVSGGKDSDLMVDLFSKLDESNSVHYVWFDTGLEYQATKSHLDYLERRYGIKIDRVPAIKSIPLSCMTYGQPFLNKFASEMIGRLEGIGFGWEDGSYDYLIKKYPEGRSAIKWWCNGYDKPRFTEKGIHSQFSIGRNKHLKEFLIANPPNFPISSKCCKYAKKYVSKKLIKDRKIDCMCTGIRRAENGIRITMKTCFTRDKEPGSDYFMPLFWLNGEDEAEYFKKFNVRHSDCYEVWGMERTGCVGCPYNRKLNQEKQFIEKYEPKIYKAVCNVFKDAYRYTAEYNEFYNRKQAEEKLRKD